MSESGLGTMVPIQKLESHSSCSGGENHTQALNKKSGNLGFGSGFVTSQLGRDFRHIFTFCEFLNCPVTT